ncbi:hypothetical protein BDF22DRAFT_744130 [Syncephalis plumigaleata]|nr:hypothetical protein BDF22DRAFT_744130 [Syncephalis plumigaleata]
MSQTTNDTCLSTSKSAVASSESREHITTRDEERLSTATSLAPPRHSVKTHGVSTQEALALRRQRHLEAHNRDESDITDEVTSMSATTTRSTADKATTSTKDAVARSGRKRVKRQPLMEGETMTLLPMDLEQEWYAVQCPVGTILGNFESILPAGSRAYRGNRSSDYCILDCIYVEQTFTYYILDLMCWKGHPFFNCETEFRSFWLQTQLAELEEPRSQKQQQQRQWYRFEALAMREATRDHLEQIVRQISASSMMDEGTRTDGVLLVHRRTHYVPGRTPLCGWISVEHARTMLTSYLTGQ